MTIEFTTENFPHLEDFSILFFYFLNDRIIKHVHLVLIAGIVFTCQQSPFILSPARWNPQGLETEPIWRLAERSGRIGELLQEPHRLEDIPHYQVRHRLVLSIFLVQKWSFFQQHTMVYRRVFTLRNILPLDIERHNARAVLPYSYYFFGEFLNEILLALFGHVLLVWKIHLVGLLINLAFGWFRLKTAPSRIQRTRYKAITSISGWRNIGRLLRLLAYVLITLWCRLFPWFVGRGPRQWGFGLPHVPLCRSPVSFRRRQAAAPPASFWERDLATFGFVVHFIVILFRSFDDLFFISIISCFNAPSKRVFE